jgi:hypothetical protein
MKILLTAGAAALALMAAPAAFAAPGGGGGGGGGGLVYFGGCSDSDVNPAASACYGYFEGNQVLDATAQATAFGAGGLNVGPLSLIEKHDTDGTADNTFDFTSSLNGTVVIGVHWGAAQGTPFFGHQGGGTGFYKIDLAPNANLHTITGAFLAGNSNYALFKTSECVGRGCGGTDTGVPEPATWALMILGFGGAGATLRRRRAAIA